MKTYNLLIVETFGKYIFKEYRQVHHLSTNDFVVVFKK